MPRIIFDCERMKYPDNGLYHYCLNLGKSLDANKNAGEELCFYAPLSAGKFFNTGGKHIIQNSLQKFWMPSLKGFDIWHGTYQNSQYLPSAGKKIKVVLTVHDLNFMYDERKAENKKHRSLRHVQKLIDRADALVFISEFTQKDVLNRCNTGNKPYYLIYNGSNFLDKPLLSGCSYIPRKPFLFSIGVINRKKNFHTLVPLVRGGEIELVIAGKKEDPDYYKYIQKSACNYGVQNDVHLLGSITESEKAWYYKNCKAFAFPSVSEGFGAPVVEAMSMGKPVFLSSRTALPEIGGNVSFYFKDFREEHMRDVFNTGMTQYAGSRLHQQITDRAAGFSWNKAAQQYWEVYRSLY